MYVCMCVGNNPPPPPPPPHQIRGRSEGINYILYIGRGVVSVTLMMATTKAHTEKGLWRTNTSEILE